MRLKEKLRFYSWDGKKAFERGEGEKFEGWGKR